MRLGGLTLYELHDKTGLPGCFIEELLQNDFRPDTSWAKDLPAYQAYKQVMNAYDVVSRDSRFTPQNSTPYVCYWTTVILYQRKAWAIGHAVELARYDLTPRSWPRISFVERWNELWEVTGGRVFYAGGAWRWEHTCYRNTELARHFRGACQIDLPNWPAGNCVPCRQIEFLKEYGHGNYGRCGSCGSVDVLIPKRDSPKTKFGYAEDVVMARHKRPDGRWCEYSELCNVFEYLEPMEAREVRA